MDVKYRVMVAVLSLSKSLSIKNVTMDDIAHQSGISKKTLYQHFRNKNEVIDYLIERSQELFQVRCDTIITTTPNAVHALQQILILLNEVSLDWNRVTLFQFQKYYPLSFDKYMAGVKNIHISIIKKVVDMCKEAGFIRPEVNATVFASYSISQLFVFAEKMLGETWTVQDRRIVNDITMRGILTPSGVKKYLTVT